MAKKRSKPKKAPESLNVEKYQRVVDDPDFSRDHQEGKLGNKRQKTVEVNAKESAIETLYARRFIFPVQKMAADRFRALYEAAGGKTKSLDYTQDRVDGGGGDPIVTRLTAAKELESCERQLGRRHFRNVEMLCGEGRALSELATNKRDRLTLADNLRADLDDLAIRWGFMARR